LVVSLVALPALAVVPSSEPTYIEDPADTITVDGDTSDWDLTENYFADMYRAGDPGKDVLSKLYLRYDCTTFTLYALVLVEPGHTIDVDFGDGEHYIKLGNSTTLVDDTDGDDGTPPDFHWVGLSGDGTTAQGWEASTELWPDAYTNFNVHTQVDDGETSAVTGRSIDLTLICWDLGDLPDTYPTTWSDTKDGPRHQIGNIWLGDYIDAEYDGVPTSTCDGDDLNQSPNDEDGVVRTTNWSVGTDGAQIRVDVTGGTGYLYGWIDWNEDGVFGSGEMVLSNVALPSGSHLLSFDVPASVDFGTEPTFGTRFRLYEDTPASPSPSGEAINGEVEDYCWSFGPNAVTTISLSAGADNGPAITLALTATLMTVGVLGVRILGRRDSSV
jgi:hypothetical protein